MFLNFEILGPELNVPVVVGLIVVSDCLTSKSHAAIQLISLNEQTKIYNLSMKFLFYWGAIVMLLLSCKKNVIVIAMRWNKRKEKKKKYVQKNPAQN